MYKIPLNPFGEPSTTMIQLGELFIPKDPANTDYQAYLKWLEEGNTPEPADEGQ